MDEIDTENNSQQTPMGRHASQAVEAGKPVQELVAAVVESLKKQAEEGVSALPKSNLKDSVFTNLFQIPEYALQLYQSLHPEDTAVTVGQIRPVTLANVLLNQMYNDLAIAVRDKLIILLEHQSTWTPNIIIRILIYYVMILNGFIMETGQNIYTTARLDFPKPEFYVVFTGKRESRPKVVKMSEEFFGGLDADLEVKVHMLYGDGSGSVVDQFVDFSDIYSEQYGLHGRSRETVKETVRICMERGILREYLEGRRKEVEDIMTALLNENYIMEAYTREVEQKGRDEGRAEGEEKAKIEMAKKLYDMGLGVDKIVQAVSYPVEVVEQWLGLVTV